MTAKPQLTFVMLDPKSERGLLWERITGGCIFEATPAIGGFYQLNLGQFDRAVLTAIYAELADRQGGTPAEVRAYIERLGFIPLKHGPDATFGASLRMLV